MAPKYCPSLKTLTLDSLMFDYDDDLPEVKTSLIDQWNDGKGMVRSLMKVGLTFGVAVGAATVVAVTSIERARG